ncbi:hypothetical protein TEA_028004 [Camellia sinensis var. sinensis]|uniref:Signal peptidase complex subunit 3 n=1 Tax=Camellia sinensis var. sinensis TaxID=542762 RepID=A0A4S4DB71_CAMSN|nr:hypothetical protein TEA_028004 [Camellia sinensis var. sinensis]
MHSFGYRANALLTFAVTLLALICAMSSLSDNLNSPSPSSHVKVLNINWFQKSTQGNDEVSLSIVNVDSCYTAAIEDSLTYLGREATKVCLLYPLQVPPIYLPLLHQDHKYKQRIIPKLVRWKKSAFPAWCRTVTIGSPLTNWDDSSCVLVASQHDNEYISKLTVIVYMEYKAGFGGVVVVDLWVESSTRTEVRNVKAAEYETPQNSLNQVSLWDGIIPSKEHAKFWIHTTNKYRFTDQGSNLQGKEFNLTLHWHVMPKTGKMFADKIVAKEDPPILGLERSQTSVEVEKGSIMVEEAIAIGGGGDDCGMDDARGVKKTLKR